MDAHGIQLTDKVQSFVQRYEQQIKYAKKLLENKLPKISPIANYVPHHRVLNKKKLKKVCVVFVWFLCGFCVVFDAAAMNHETRLHNILPEIDFPNNLVSLLFLFSQGEYAVISSIEACFTKCVNQALVLML